VFNGIKEITELNILIYPKTCSLEMMPPNNDTCIAASMLLLMVPRSLVEFHGVLRIDGSEQK